MDVLEPFYKWGETFPRAPPRDTDSVPLTKVFRYKEIRENEENLPFLSKEYLDKIITFLQCYVRNTDISPISW
jgi:hypothetical protein